MEIVGKPDEVPPVQTEVQTEIDAAQGRPWPMGSIERFAFYELAKNAYCVIQTGERRFYGCFVFKKASLRPTPDLGHASKRSRLDEAARHALARPRASAS